MDLPINRREPLVMHIDLNSCFASVEQQANRTLRGRPIVVAAYPTPGDCVLAPSIEAKALGVKVGMRVRDAQAICRDVIVLTPDVAKVHAVHERMMRVFRRYAADMTPKSIDEAVLDFAHCEAVVKRPLTNIAQEIKTSIKKEIGEWLRCSIGIGANRFLAKVGAGLRKPDGLDVIRADNLREVYGRLKLVDLPGINTRYEARLNTCGIFTPLEFLDASWETLVKQVFKSTEGHRWYLRLRGWEVDDVSFRRRSFGHSYALPRPTADRPTLSRLVMKLAEKTGRRLRRAERHAYGIHVSCLYTNRTYWHKGHKLPTPVYATPEIYLAAQRLLNTQPAVLPVAILAITCFALEPFRPEQMPLFEKPSDKLRRLADATDIINDKYGEFMATPAIMMGMEKEVLERISFGNTKQQNKNRGAGDGSLLT